MAHSTSVYHVSGLGTVPRNSGHKSAFSGIMSHSNHHRENSRSSHHINAQNGQNGRRNRSNSSGCFLDTLELETPTPPPPPPIAAINSKSYFRQDKPKYKFNGFMQQHSNAKISSAATDFTSAGSPPITPVPTPPPPPPLNSTKVMKHFDYNKSPAHVL